MTNSSDPERGGQQPGDRSPEGQPDGDAAGPPPAEQVAQPAASPPGPYPQAGPDGRPSQYPQPGHYPGEYPVQYGQYPGQTAPGAPYGDRGGYTYTPYGTYPAGMPEPDQPAPTRPGAMNLALVLLVLSAIPFLLLGLLSQLLPPDISGLPPDVVAQVERELAAGGVTYEEVLAGVGPLAVFSVGTALVYLGFAVLAFLGRAWARVVLTIMTAGFALFLLWAVVGDPVAGFVLLPIVAAAVVGTGLLYGSAASRYIAARRG